MNDIGWISILPPLIAVILAIRTKEVYFSLISGLFFGYLILAEWHPLNGFFQMMNGVITVFHDDGNVRVVLFTLLIGVLIRFTKDYGGANAFANRIFKSVNANQDATVEKKAQFYTMGLGLLLFIETNISILTTGTIFKPIYDKVKLPRTKLAYILDSTSSPSSILLPFNAWGAFIVGLLMQNGFEYPVDLFFQSVWINFYPFMAIALVIMTILLGKSKQVEKVFRTTAYRDVKTVSQTIETEGDTLWDMILPFGVMVVSMPCYMIYSGWGEDTHDMLSAFKNGSGSFSVLFSVLNGIIVMLVLLMATKRWNTSKINTLAMNGMKDMMEMALLMILAFALGSMAKSLGTGNYVASLVLSNIHLGLIPALFFVISGFIAFSTGTSWGTFAIMIPLMAGISTTGEVNEALLLAAILGGGVFGDHCSPVSDTTLISSIASDCDHMEHVNTQLPFALFAGGISLVLFLIVGFII